MQIIDLAVKYVEQAAQIAYQNYEEERVFVTTLPPIDKLPDLTEFAINRRGFAAEDNGELLGFLCWHTPWDNHFGLSKGTWSPVHAHGAIIQNRLEIYDRLYQAAAEKLVSDGVFCHSVTLYEHDKDANESFIQNGFGRRCVDAIRETAPIISTPCGDLIFRRADVNDAEAVTEMRNGTSTHLSQTPMFMPFLNPVTVADTIKEIECAEYMYFVALKQNRPIAYYRIQISGENFVCDDVSMMNITGAYALPDYRGSGVAVHLLSWLMDWLHGHGYSRCGVDFECFNFAARKFWLKYFTAYTNGAVRRIDERICSKTI